jgi:hypothetical protein
MAAAGSSRKINDLLADDGFNPIGHLNPGVLLDVAPNLLQFLMEAVEEVQA